MRRCARNTVSLFRQGFDSRIDGQGKAACPTFDGSLPMRMEWLAGWEEADRILSRSDRDGKLGAVEKG